MKIKNIETAFAKMETDNPRKAAELAYVIAMNAKRKGDNEKAKQYGQKSIGIFRILNVQSYEDCAARYTTVNNIALPDLIHEDVVRDRLRPIEV